MWHGDEVAVADARGHGPVRRVLEERGRHELEARLVLRQVDVAALARQPAAQERGEHRGDAVPDRDVVDVRPVQQHRRPILLTEQVKEAGERGELAAVPGNARVRTGLSLITAREHDEVGTLAEEPLVVEAPLRHVTRCEALDDHVRLRDERARELGSARVLQVERHAELALVVEREHARPVETRNVVLERRVRGPERVGRGRGLHVDDLGAVVREVLADERAGRGEAELDDAQPRECRPLRA